MSSDSQESLETTTPRAIVSSASSLKRTTHFDELELQAMICANQQRTTAVAGIDPERLAAMVERMNQTQPACPVCAQLLVDCRLLHLALYKGQERLLKLAENRLTDEEEMEREGCDLCCCCTINFV